MSLRLAELQKSDNDIQKIRAKGLDKYKNINKMLYYQELLFIPEIIWSKLISQHYNNLLIGHFDIDKTKKLIS